MNRYYNKTKLEDKIQRITNKHPDSVIACEEIVKYCRMCLQELRTKVLSQGFLNEMDEIYFFKFTKQIPLLNLIYYARLQKIILATPTHSKKAKKRFFRKKLQETCVHLQKHKDFHNYLRLNHTHYDRFYFTRGGNVLVSSEFQNIIDPDFSTSHDMLMAELNSYVKLVTYLDRQISELKNKKDSPSLNWTSSKVSLIELVYALYHSRAIDNGKTEIKEIASIFQDLFNLDLSDIYRGYCDIKSRKLERVRFLNELKSNLLSHLETENKI